MVMKKKMKYINNCWFLFFLFTIIFISPSSSSSPSTNPSPVTKSKNKIKPTKLIDSICQKTKNYNFCIDALYTDNRAPDADQLVLTYISFGLAYLNATNTKSYIKHILTNKNNFNNGGNSTNEDLKRCNLDYGKAKSALIEAYNNLNSETYFGLGTLSGVAANAAKDCQDKLDQSTISNSPLTRRNEDLSRLCEISAIASSSFSSS